MGDLKQLFGTSGARIVSVAASIIMLMITARALGPDGRGIIASATTLAQLLSTIASLSLGQIIVHRLSKKSDPESLGALVGNLIALSVALSGLSIGIYLVLTLINPALVLNLPIWALAMVLMVTPFLIWEKYGAQLLICTGLLGFFNRRVILVSLASLVAMYIALYLMKFGVKTALGITVIGSMFVALAGAWQLRQLIKSKMSFSWPESKQLVIDGLKLHANAIGAILMTSINVLIVNLHSGLSETGYYQLAMQMALLFAIVPQSVGIILSRLTVEHGPNGVWPRQKMLILITLALNVAAAIAAYLISPLAVQVVAGEKFMPAADIFRVLLIGTFGLSMSYVMANQWLSRGLFTQVSIIAITMGVVQSILSYWAAMTYGVYGVAWAWSGVYSLGFCFSVAMSLYVERTAKTSKVHNGA